MFCKHEWEVLSETITKSQAEHAVEVGLCVKKGSELILERKHIQVFHCKKCGRLERFVEAI